MKNNLYEEKSGSCARLKTFCGIIENKATTIRGATKLKNKIAPSGIDEKKPNFRSVNLTARNWRKTGYTVNPNFLYKENYESIKFKDLLRLYKNYIQNKPITITVVGNKEAIDMEKLAEFGELIEVSKKDIFN